MGAASSEFARKRKYLRLKKDISHLLRFDHGSVNNLAPAEYRFYFASQQIFLVTLIAHVLFLVLFVYLRIPGLIYFNIASIAAYLICLQLNRHNKFLTAITIAFIEINIHALIATIYIGWESGFYYYLLGVGPVAFLNDRISLKTKVIFSTISIILLAYLYLNYLNVKPVVIVEASLLGNIYLFNTIGLYVILSYLAFLYHWAAKRSDKHLLSIGEKWEQLASIDMLTCLPNRRAMNEILQQEISRVYRGTSPFALVLADIDNFKQINDKYGHIIGDHVLKDAAKIIRKALRKHDVVCRWGGEEFLLLLPETDEEGSYDALQKIRKKLEKTSFVFDGEEINITITMGVCLFQPGDKIEDCISTADSALYEGKMSGKNKVVISYNKMLSLKL